MEWRTRVVNGAHGGPWRGAAFTSFHIFHVSLVPSMRTMLLAFELLSLSHYGKRKLHHRRTYLPMIDDIYDRS